MDLPGLRQELLKIGQHQDGNANEEFAALPLLPYPQGQASRKPVICLETGKTYPSAEAAAAEVSRTGGAISVACREGTKSAGFHWKYVSENDV